MSLEFVQNCSEKPSGTTNVSTSNESLAASFGKTEMTHTEILKLTFQVLVAFLGVSGNALVVIVTCRVEKKRKPADFYVQNLAIADLGTLLLTFPLAALKEKVPENWPFGKFGCLLSPVPEVFYGASVWCIAAIAIERYRKILSVQAPGQNRRNASLRSAKTIAACVWVISFLFFSLPLHFVVEYREIATDGKSCGPVWKSLVLAQVYIGLLAFLSFILPLVVISFTYLKISRAINQSSVFFKVMAVEKQGMAEEKPHSLSLRRIRLNQNKRAKNLLTPVVLVFAVTMLPLNILRLTSVFWPPIAAKKYYENLFFVVSVFVIINSSANPVIYSVVSKGFRTEIMKLIGGKGKGKYFNFSGIFRSFNRSPSQTSGRHCSTQERQQQPSSFSACVYKTIDLG